MNQVMLPGSKCLRFEAYQACHAVSHLTSMHRMSNASWLVVVHRHCTLLNTYSGNQSSIGQVITPALLSLC